jgi:hypothetical protein
MLTGGEGRRKTRAAQVVRRDPVTTTDEEHT